jgi:hypothetical protein
MADPELVSFVRKNIAHLGEDGVREQMLREGAEPEEVEEAIAAAGAPEARSGASMAILAVVGGGILLAAAAMLSNQPPQLDRPPGKPGDAAESPQSYMSETDSVFHGHAGYMLRLPQGYEAQSSFQDAEKTQETVYIYKKGTDPSHFIHEGLYGALGIFRLEVMPRRIPQGFVGVDTLRGWVTRKLDQEKATYTVRSLIVQGMPSFIVVATKPFQYAQAYCVGERVRYMLIGGDDGELFTAILSSLAEVAPHGRQPQ